MKVRFGLLDRHRNEFCSYCRRAARQCRELPIALMHFLYAIVARRKGTSTIGTALDDGWCGVQLARCSSTHAAVVKITYLIVQSICYVAQIQMLCKLMRNHQHTRTCNSPSAEAREPRRRLGSQYRMHNADCAWAWARHACALSGRCPHMDDVDASNDSPQTSDAANRRTCAIY